MGSLEELLQDTANSLSSAQTVFLARHVTVRRRPARALYAALAVLFVIAAGYQVRALKQIFPHWFGA